MKASILKYAVRYSDDSGDQFAVTLDKEKGNVTIHSRSTEAEIPLDQLDWFMEALAKVQAEAQTK